jgi:N-acyl amino acid synthase of PEP-CTERM/exosortase system
VQTEALSLAENFLQYFDVAFAVSPAQKREVFHIRFNVYCTEFNYEDASSFPSGEEIDEFDEHSYHALITHKGSGLPAGCVRMVKTTGDRGSDPLPFEKHCPGTLDESFIEGLELDRQTVCEISRLAVDGTFRRRPGEKDTRYGEIDGLDATQHERRTFALIAVACFLSATAMTSLAGRTNVFAMMEPFLPKLMARSGINFQRAGEDVDYHGIRAPYFIRTQWALDGMLPELRELYDAIHGRISEDFPRR